ncbi:hypothetical protein JMN32_19135 [Fulvivirga sp. 29W222]|uniref:DUF3857 domain-containing protein n=1 Tax=Fulvivirga marina TaxID=2494733 RepID=A0A937G4T1_9BACT|nr:hypothetical protein [Fulvivirga marina]MBL6448436.1 hypothetical protein [Fulvivirga marina]
MIKYSIKILLFVLVIAHVASAANDDPKRAEEVRQMMWKDSDPEFSVTAIPNKWKDKSAVIIAKYNMLSYRKAALSTSLEYIRYNHNRIMLLDKSAIEDYSQFTIPESGTYGNIRSAFYAGFKIVKPDGREIEIPLSKAVKEELEVNNSGFNKLKLAIPNLEEGDILDYYFGEERRIVLASKYFSFDPVIFQLHGDYPVMKQKITFDVLRRCFINLKSLNGAPDFALASDHKNDKNTYTLVDEDRESIKDIRWLYPNRQIPSIKFKITYASSFAASAPTFIGEPGVLKSEVTKEETKKLVQYMFNTSSYYGGELKAYMKKHHKKEKDLNKLAREAYYAYRNINRIKNTEARLLYGKNANESSSIVRDVITLSNYYRWNDIPHKVIIGVPREISSIDDLILENELMMMIKVTTTDPFYVGRFTNHSIVGEIDESLQGTRAYQVDGVLPTPYWVLNETKVPVHNASENNTMSTYAIKVLDLDEDKVNIAIKKSVSGANRIFYQNVLMDIYDFKEEEASRFDMGEDFEGYKKSEQKKLLQRKTDYVVNREKQFNESLKAVVSNDLDLIIDEPKDLEVKQTGRFHDEPEFIYTCNTDASGAIKKAGRNYLVNIGKFIDGQIHLSDEERKERKYDVYDSYARSFEYRIEFIIPEGYEVQGLEKLENNVENATGGFTSAAKIDGDKLIIESKKYYSSNFNKKEDWPLMVEFLDAAYNFTQQQILLRKQ